MTSHAEGPTASTSVASGWWRWAQGASLVVFAAMVAGLLVAPELSLALVWNVVVPLVPASLLISPIFWRGVCPIATLNMMPNGWLARRRPSTSWMPLITATGILLFGVLVPARHFLFNANAAALAILLIGVGVLAFALGTVFDMKAGFCNSVCPLLAVERLYGQRPMVSLGNPRCATCSVCTPKGCIDLAPLKATAQVLGRGRRTHAWLRSPFGVFAAAFPGFVIGYFATGDAALSAAPGIYLVAALWTIGSYLATNIVIRTMRLSAAVALPLLAAFAIGSYYWFAAPATVTVLGLSPSWTIVFRAAAGTLIFTWLWKAIASERRGSRIRPKP